MDQPDPTFIHTRYYNVRAPHSGYRIAKSVALPGTNQYTSNLLVAAGQPVSYKLEFYPVHYLADPAAPETYTITAVDTLPGCAVPGEPTISTSYGWDWEWEYIPPVGDPCYGDGEPGQILWTGTPPGPSWEDPPSGTRSR